MHYTTRPKITGRKGVVSAGHYLAAAAGTRMLAIGGNAIDAGVAAGFALTVLKPCENSMGGDVRIGSETWRPNLDGTRAEAGATLLWRPGARFQLHLDYEAAHGNNYKKPWDISLGFRLMF